MKEKKTVLFLMNGFGVEATKSFEVYSNETMPTFNKLITAYPFKLLFSNGEFIGANDGEVSNFKSGYLNFSTFGHPSRKVDVVGNKIASNEFITNTIINNSIDIAVKNESRLHVFFTVGDKVGNDRFEHLKAYCDLALKKGVKNIYLHVILGDNSVRGLKNGNEHIRVLKNRVIRYYPQVKITSISGRKYMKDGNHDDIANFYRMMVSGVGEIWVDYAATLTKKYASGLTDDNMNGFLTIRENVLRAGDSIFMFNYSNNIGKKIFEVVLNPKKFFPTSNVPGNIAINSLFTINNMPNIPCAYHDELPETYFLDKIPKDKKILIIAEKDRIPYVSKSLNGFRTSFSSNVNVWPIEDKANRFDSISQYLAAYINQSVYDLIIVDCNLYDPSVDQRTIEQVKTNLKALDRCINITYNRIMEKDYRFIATSLYGLKGTFKLTSTMELIDLSQKTPFLLIDKEIRRVDVSFGAEGTFIDVARIVASTFGNPMPNKLITMGEEKKEVQKKQTKLLVFIPIVALIILVIAYVVIMYM